MECLDDRDDSIRLRALDLISGMVSKKNLVEIVKKLILHMDTSESASESVDTHTQLDLDTIKHGQLSKPYLLYIAKWNFHITTNPP